MWMAKEKIIDSRKNDINNRNATDCRSTFDSSGSEGHKGSRKRTRAVPAIEVGNIHCAIFLLSGLGSRYFIGI